MGVLKLHNYSPHMHLQVVYKSQIKLILCKYVKSNSYHTIKKSTQCTHNCIISGYQQISHSQVKSGFFQPGAKKRWVGYKVINIAAKQMAKLIKV